MFEDGNKPKALENPLNDRFEKAEFRKLWAAINHKYAYTVDFDSDELVRKAIAHIDSELNVSRLQYTTCSNRRGSTRSPSLFRRRRRRCMGPRLRIRRRRPPTRTIRFSLTP